ncbi:MAG TPA: hypothetical protein DER09_01725 [Prolixibacteraceae bacterium]|nr:hypothetical protein [Prolixibacteraceae bacterium]
MKPTILLFFTFLILLQPVAQGQEITSNSYWRTGFKQINESANFGLVFSGANINYGHYRESSKNNRIFSIENEIGVCIPFSKGIPALDVYLKPAEISYLFSASGKNTFAVGPLAKFEYNYTLYPQLQSAFDYWFTNFSLGVNSRYDFTIAGQQLSARLKFTVLGFTSRQPESRNPYWYDIGFQHAIKHLNSDFEFSTLSQFNTTDFELSWKPKSEKRITWSYCFDYSGYFEAPEILMISHNIKLTFNPKNK